MKLHQRGYMVALRELVDSGRYDTRYINSSVAYRMAQYTIFTIFMYRILIHTGKGGGGEVNQREGESSNSSQSWSVP